MRVIKLFITPLITPLVLFTLLLNQQVLSGQDVVPLRQWLSESKGQLEQAFDQSIRNSNFRPSWVEKVEIRSETDEFLLNRQEYTLRFSPATPAIRKAQKNLIKLNNQEAALYVSELRTELMKILLEDFVEVYELTRKQELLAEKRLILEDQHKVSMRMIQQPDFNPKKLLEIEKDQHELKIESYETELSLKKLLENRENPDFQELISTQEIERILSQLILQEKSLEDDEKYLLEQEIVDAEIKMEKAEKRRVLDFVQARYRGPHDNILNERVSIGVGIELPFSGSVKTKMEQLKVEKWKLEQEANMQLQLASIELSKSAEELRRSIQTWRFAEQMFQQSLKEFQQIENSSVESEWKSPELLLYKKAQQVERKLDLLNLEKDIYQQYIDMLQQAGLTSDDSYLDLLVNN